MKKKYIALISCDVPSSSASLLADDFHLFYLRREDNLPRPVSSHPDMILSVIGEKIILSEQYYAANRDVIDPICRLAKLSPLISHTEKRYKYPYDAAFNAAVGDGFIICRAKSVANEILTMAEQYKISICNVNQGYSGCSCIVTPAAVLTSDMGIKKALDRNGIKAIFITNKNILLPGYNIGFLGGCGGFCDGTIYLFGKDKTPERNSTLSEFANENGYEIKYLSSDPLTDYGGIKFIKIKEQCADI